MKANSTITSFKQITIHPIEGNIVPSDIFEFVLSEIRNHPVICKYSQNKIQIEKKRLEKKIRMKLNKRKGEFNFPLPLYNSTEYICLNQF